jgi:hypothetical protein
MLLLQNGASNGERKCFFLVSFLFSDVSSDLAPAGQRLAWEDVVVVLPNWKK